MTDVQNTTQDGGGSAGRPRPQDTIARDQHVLDALTKHGQPASRNQIAELAGIQPSHAYLSLIRLRQDNKVRRAEGGRHTWEAVPQA